ncbi:MAG TPA: type II CAAX endopeptidase family protein [Anaerolineales bacterium]|nr:type II CAAX endopeptidase family protein [Anaerolineales bacterium]
MTEKPTPSGAFPRLFISPDERRLRAGWRLLGHSALLLILGVVFSVVLAIPLAVFQFVSRQNLTNAILALSTVVSLPAITLATWIARRGLDRRSFRSLGLELGTGWSRDLLVGFAIPIPLFGLIYLFELGAGWLDFQSWGWAERGVLATAVGVLLLLLAFVAVGFYEELLVRGYYLQNLKDGTNLVVAVFATSAAFGLAHLGNPNASWTSTLGIFAAGLFLAYAWLRTRALWLPIGIHIGWNFLQGPVFGFEVSGIPTPSLVRHVVNGPELITGGAFGPEAGLLVLPAMALGAGLIWWYTRHRVTAVGSPSAAEQG